MKKHTEEGYARGDHPDCYQYGGNCFEKRSFLYGENTLTLTREEYLEELQKSLNDKIDNNGYEKKLGMFDKKSMEPMSRIMLIDVNDLKKECENKSGKEFTNIDSKDIKEIYKELILGVLLEFLHNINDCPNGVFKTLDDFNKHLFFYKSPKHFSTERVRTLLNFVRCMDSFKKIKTVSIRSYVPSSESQEESIKYTIQFTQSNAKSIETGANESIRVIIIINVPILDYKNFYIDYPDLYDVSSIVKEDKNVPDLTHLMSKTSVSMTEPSMNKLSMTELYFVERMLRIALFSYYDGVFLKHPVSIPLKEKSTGKPSGYGIDMALTIPPKEELTKAMIPPKKE